MKVSYWVLFSITVSTVAVLIVAYAILTFQPWKQPSGEFKPQTHHIGRESRMAVVCSGQAANLTTLLKTQEMKHKLEIERLRRKFLEMHEKINLTSAQLKTLGKVERTCSESSGIVGAVACGADPFKLRVNELNKNRAIKQFSEV